MTIPGCRSLEKHTANHPSGFGSDIYFGIEGLRLAVPNDIEVK
jgi:hypothetical protein